MTWPFKQLLTIDFETRWSTKPTVWCEGPYTLSKMTTEEYIRSPLFCAFGACFHEYGSRADTVWVRHEDLPEYLAGIDWTTTAALAHSSQFDIAILSYIYGVTPCFVFDTLSMGRALRGVEVGNSLMKLAEDYGLPPKGKALHSTDGLLDIPPSIEQELAAYCTHDVHLCEQIFAKLLYRVDPVTGEIGGQFPTKELRLIDMTVRMYTDPVLALDEDMLTKALAEEKEKLQLALEKTGLEESQLASNDQFADALRMVGVEPPTKISKTTGKEAYAFAKNDALFLALRNGENEDAALLCEARLRVKSTLERTRAQRFIDISQRGTLPIPLAYYGAATGRWAAAKGANLNLQNLKRGSFLRKAIMAPDGYMLAVADLSQIEPRVLAWFSDYTEMLDIFRAGGDPYATFGAQMFNTPGLTKDSHPLLRQSAKSAMLGCFGSQTPVLTKRGWVTIVDVSTGDLLWDGMEWVTHSGLLAQGEKEVLTWMGVSATSDHEILTGHGWRAWNVVLQNISLFQSALSLGSLSAFDGSGSTATEKTEPPQACSTRSCDAAAGGRGSYTAPISKKEQAHAAEHARARKPFSNAGKPKDTSRYALTLHTVTGYLTASVPSLFAAVTQKAQHTLTTAGAALRCILRGWKTELPFLSTLSLFPDGTSLNFSSTAATTTAGMFREICGSSHAAKTWLTSERSRREKSLHCVNVSQPLKQRMQTYDIALAGPRNRYTILTDAGPIVVHNCGFQLGGISFAAQLLVGFLGAPPVRYDKDMAKQLGVTQQDVQKFIGWDDNIRRMNEIAHTCTEEELLVHCLAAIAIINKYRATAHSVVSFWELLSHLIEHSLYGGKEYNFKDVLLFRKGEIVMANGMSLRYPDLQQSKDEKGRTQYTFADGNKRAKLYAGRVCNNVTQGTARIVMSDGLLRIDKEYRVLGTVHDEGIALVPEEIAQPGYQWMLKQMTKTPKWMPGIPLAADGGVHRRYGMAKN